MAKGGSSQGGNLVLAGKKAAPRKKAGDVMFNDGEEIGAGFFDDVGNFFKKAATSVVDKVASDPIGTFKTVAPLLLAAGKDGKPKGKGKGGNTKLAGNAKLAGNTKLAGNAKLAGSVKLAGNVDIGGAGDSEPELELNEMLGGVRRKMDAIEEKIFNMQLHGYDPVTQFNSTRYNNEQLENMERNAKHQQDYIYGRTLDVRPKTSLRRI